ncbi:FtsX-like permease family protein [Halomarina litorea]|uniref:FtsX-like permease family protein n=1 Tax=Halomarina litorea TaxID=2961595 RepID=UPI0020C566E3|nr:FtsX-like permease family protein [Halomarina sp. BCD28]
MSYRRALLTRWSRRDRLAVLVVGVTVAFLVGSVVVLLAVSAQSVAIADQFESAASVGLAGTGDSETPAVRLPVAVVTDEDGRERTVVGVPAESSLPATSTRGLARPGAEATTRTLRGSSSTLDVPVRLADGSTLAPDSWYVADAEAVERLGVTRTLAVRPTARTVPDSGAPLTGALAYFVAGTRQVLALLGVVSAAAAVIVSVIVHSVTRMSVRDRRGAIRVLRSTGATPRQVIVLFAVRAGLLTATGIALGYAVGVIVPNAAVGVAISAGLPVGLDLAMTGRTARIVAGLMGATLAVGVLAGALAARPAATGAPTAPEGGRRLSAALPDRVLPETLSARAFVPTTSALTVFVTFVLVLASLSGLLVGIGGTADGTIAEPGAVHPVASTVDEGYADALRAAGRNASPEILLFQVVDGHPFPARGVQFEAYRQFEGAEVVAGRTPVPDATGEAVVGRSLADTLDVGVGDTVVLGGSTEAAIATVEVVGVFRASGIANDHLLVSLPLARHLRGMGPQAVNIVRVEDRPTGAAGESLAVLGVDAPRRVPAGKELTAGIRLRNIGSTPSSRTVVARFDGQEESLDVTLAPDGSTTRTVSFATETPGNYTLTVDDRTRTVTVVPPGALRVSNVPTTGPPGSAVNLRVRTVAGEPAANATVTLGNRTTRTDARGKVVLRLPADPDTYTLRVRRGERELTRPIRVATDATRAPVASLTVPERTTVLSPATVRARLVNPWDVPVTRRVRVRGPGTDATRVLTVPPGGSRTLSTDLQRTAPGTYDVVMSLNGSVAAERTYTVTGDARLGSALASSGRLQRGGGVDGLLERAFGNVGLLLGTLVVLGGLMTTGSLTAAFASAAQARTREVGIRRATGDSPRGVVGAVLRDAARIAIPATVLGTLLALVVRAALARAGLLTVFGVHLSTPVPLATLAGILIAALALAMGSAALVAAGFVLRDPAALLRSGGDG